MNACRSSRKPKSTLVRDCEKRYNLHASGKHGQIHFFVLSKVDDMGELSVCGIYDCEGCKFREDALCLGCSSGNAYLEQWARDPCKIYSCAKAQGISTCKDCIRPVCTLRGATDIVCPLRAGTEGSRHWAWRIAQHLDNRGTPCRRSPAVPLKTVMRLRWYLSALDGFAEQGVGVVTSRELADRVGMRSAIVRKDFSRFGELGTPGLGYSVAHLQDQIHSILSSNTCELVWVGGQWLESALSIFARPNNLNFHIVAAADSRPEWIGKRVGDWEILPLSDLQTLMETTTIDGAVLALPEDAERTADVLVEAGIKGILNLTHHTLKVPPEISVHHIDLLGEIMALASECSELSRAV